MPSAALPATTVTLVISAAQMAAVPLQMENVVVWRLRLHKWDRANIVLLGDGYGYCEAGNHCYTYEGFSRDVCCTDSDCTAIVIGGTTSTVRTPVEAPTGTDVPTITQAPPVPSETTESTFDYYTYSVSWWYYYYYWTYYVSIQASIVTSTRTTQYTTVTLSATNSAAAQVILASITSDLPTPASATALATLTDETITVSDTSSRPSGPTPPPSEPPGGGPGGDGGPSDNGGSEPTSPSTVPTLPSIPAVGNATGFPTSSSTIEPASGAESVKPALLALLIPLSLIAML